MVEGLFQPVHLIIILAIVLIIFGPGKLPDHLARAIQGAVVDHDDLQPGITSAQGLQRGAAAYVMHAPRLTVDVPCGSVIL